MNGEKTEGYILSLFPLLREIKDKEIRRKTVRVWVNILKKSPWKRIEEVSHGPYYPPPSWYPKVTVVEHSNLTAKMAIEIARLAKDAYGISVNMDYLLAAAILHDACFLLERKCTEREEGGASAKSDMGKAMYVPASDIGKYTAHAFIGAHECLVLDCL